MGNVVDSFASGLGKAIGSIFHAPVDFLAGKSCSSVCGPTWDVTCYIENFCIANLLKLALILVVVYMVFLFIYLTYKLRVFHCLLCCVFKTAWTCCSTCLCTCIHCCQCFFHELSTIKRRPRRTRNHTHDVAGGSPNSILYDNEPSLKGRGRMRRHHHMMRRGHSIRNSLRPRSHRVQVGIRREHHHGSRRHHHNYSVKGYVKNRHRSMGDDVVHHGVRVTRTSKFAHKGLGSSSSRKLK